MQTTNTNTLLQIQIPTHRQDIIKLFKDFVEVFKGEVELEVEDKSSSVDDSMDKYVGKFSGEFKDLTSKDMFVNRANKL